MLKTTQNFSNDILNLQIVCLSAKPPKRMNADGGAGRKGDHKDHKRPPPPPPMCRPAPSRPEGCNATLVSYHPFLSLKKDTMHFVYFLPYLSVRGSTQVQLL